MAFHRGPKPITDGLILNIDGANPKSYPGTGTSWNDLSRNGNNITLVNGPTFDSENGGSILLDGINDYGSLSEIDIQAPWTTEIIFRTNVSTLTNNWRQTLISNSVNLQPGWIRLYVDSSSGLKRTRLVLNTIRSNNSSRRSVSWFPSPYENSYVDYQLQDAFWKDKIFSWTLSATPLNMPDQGFYSYLNGNSIGRLGVSTGDDISIKSDQIGMFLTQQRFSGNIYSVRIYDRALTEEEVVQNWNATKSRFGL
jgi:hypothetical protein